MERRAFDHLYAEISVFVGRPISRYDLWLAVWNHGGDPDELSRESVRRFVAEGLSAVLREEGVTSSPRSRRTLVSALLAFDPRFPTPEEWALRISEVANPPAPDTP
jgi:hypothetical protein